MKVNKKQEILNAALRLFTENGARATSTKSIAQEAKTSEALIFKYFHTKDGLVEELLKIGYQDAVKIITPLLLSKSPKEYIATFIEIPKILVYSNQDFWKMQYKITPLNPIASTYHNQFMKPCKERLVQCFTELKYKNPVMETEIFLLFIEGFWKHIAANDFEKDYIDEIIYLAKKKYLLSL